MSLASLQLDAFVAVAREFNFSKAAVSLHVTQSALSQRIKNLEGELGITLFIRDPSGVRLTEFGERLLRYCNTKNTLESEVLSDLTSSSKSELTGVVRIGSYSSVLRSVIIPSLSPLMREQPKLQCEFLCRDMTELPPLLQSTRVDFIVMDRFWENEGVETSLLGQEEFVMIESSHYRGREEMILDNEPGDRMTEEFMRKQKQKLKYRRSFMDDAYGIIDGVASGVGRAIMSRHLVEGQTTLKVVSQFKPWKVDVVLHYYQQPYYPKLHETIVERLTKESRKFLSM